MNETLTKRLEDLWLRAILAGDEHPRVSLELLEETMAALEAKVDGADVYAAERVAYQDGYDAAMKEAG